MLLRTTHDNIRVWWQNTELGFIYGWLDKDDYLLVTHIATEARIMHDLTQPTYQLLHLRKQQVVYWILEPGPAKNTDFCYFEAV